MSTEHTDDEANRKQNNGTPPTGHGWGERTKQTCRQYTAPDHWSTDAYEIRQRHGFRRLDELEFDYPVWPDILIHERNPTRTKSAKGTDCLVVGERGAGKSTFLAGAAERVMEENDEIVAWRGDPRRSEWLRLKHWTTLWLPEGTDVEATWMAEEEDADRPAGEVDDLEDVVRDVLFYSDPADLVEQLGAGPDGSFNVIYPDPLFRGCEEITYETEYTANPLPFTPKKDADPEGGRPASPLTHWWFAFFIAAVENGTEYRWLSWFFDEFGDLCESNPKNHDGHQTYDKIEMVKSAWIDARRRGFSTFAAIHRESQIYHGTAEEFMWRVDMPDETPNPRKKYRSSHPRGFKTVPMETDLMSRRSVGTALAYNPTYFTLFQWPHIRMEPEDRNRWIRIRFPEAREPDEPDREAADVELEFDDKLFEEWESAGDHRLYVRKPGSGTIDVRNATVIEALVAPDEPASMEPFEFVPELRDRAGCREAVLKNTESEAEQELVVARIPHESDDDGVPGLGVADD